MSKIIYITGDLILSDEPTILHGCNAQGKMGSGFALQIRNNYPDAYKTYIKYYNECGLITGLIIPAISNNKIILNAISQDKYGYDKKVYVDYQALYKIFRDLNKYGDIFDNRIAMPLIGSGLAGGSWKIISEIIEMERINYTPIVYTLDGIIPD